MNDKVRILLVDDSRSIRTALRKLVAQMHGEVVGEASDGEEAVALFTALRPDMVLLDINMPRLTGVEALKQIMIVDPMALVVMLTSQNTLEVVRECINAGAKNFLLKDNPPEVLVKELAETWLQHGKKQPDK